MRVYEFLRVGWKKTDKVSLCECRALLVVHSELAEVLSWTSKRRKRKLVEGR